jgi:hypothetical protein
MALPRSIQAQYEQAEATLAAEAARTAQPAAPEPVEVSATPPVEQPPAPEPQPVATPPVGSEEPWEHKFRSLQGLFNKEVPSLQGQVKALNARLEQALGAMEKAKTAPPEPQAPVTPPVDPRDVENFGADLVDMVNRIADRRFGSVSEQVEAKFNELKAALGQVETRLEGTSQSVAVSAEDNFFSKLAAQVPEWEKINANPAFLAWLSESDPVYGVPRQRVMDTAREQLDIGRIVNVFRAFAPATTVAPLVKDPVDRQVSPKAGASTAPQAAPAKATFTEKEITAFYNDVSKGRFRGREAEAAAIEQSVNDAIAEGRVR